GGLRRPKDQGLGHGISPWEGHKILRFEAAGAGDGLGGVGLEAARCRAEPAFERNVPAITHHRLVLVTRPPVGLDLRYEGVKRHRPTPAGSLTLVPAGRPVWAPSGRHKAELHIFLQAAVVPRGAAAARGPPPAPPPVPRRVRWGRPERGRAMSAVGAGLAAGGAGGPLAAESLANVLAVPLIRHVSSPRQPARRRDGTLPRAKLRAVVEYIEEHLDAA